VWLTVELARVFLTRVVHNGRLGARTRNLLTGVFGLGACLVFLEMAWMYLPRSHGVGYTYASRNWFNYFWRTNDLGYRDKPVDQVDLGKPRILVLGDSFTAGHGVRSEHSTFTGQLRSSLGGRAEVLNLGRNGSDSRDELRRLHRYPLRPDFLVLQYFGNDVEGAAADGGVSFDGLLTPYPDLDPAAKGWVLGSYLINYLYWLFPHSDTDAYAASSFAAYADPAILRSHLDDVAQIIQYASQNETPMIVVIFPLLTDLDRSKAYTEPIGSFFEGHGVPVIDVTDLVRDLPVRARIVNSNDAHASARVHRMVGDSLFAEIVARDWLGGDARSVP